MKKKKDSQTEGRRKRKKGCKYDRQNKVLKLTVRIGQLKVNKRNSEI